MTKAKLSAVLVLFVGACTKQSAGTLESALKEADPTVCNLTPTGVTTENYWLHFRVPPGLMPDAQYDDRPAKLFVHRVSPVYANGKCTDVPTLAAVLIHGRGGNGSTSFDLRRGLAGTGEQSVQEKLALAGIDTFAPDLLGYGRSTRFSLNDPCNASLSTDKSDNPVFLPNPQPQQTTLLGVNPLAGETCAHSSNTRFASTDVWVRDIDQVIDDVIERVRPDGNAVTLVGYSFGAQRTGRYLDKHPEKVNKVIFQAALFLTPLRAAFGFEYPTEEEPLSGSTYVTFPLALGTKPGFGIAATRETACKGRLPAGTADDYWTQNLALDELGSSWGGTVAGEPTGLNRSPTFSGYGFNSTVAHRVTVPTLVIIGTDDAGLPAVPAPHSQSGDLFNALGSANKVKVLVDCATHSMQYELCDPNEPRCTASGTAWGGPHATLTEAMIEWIRQGTFHGSSSGRYNVDRSGVLTVQ